MAPPLLPPRPPSRYTTPRPWAPLNDGELAVLAPYFTHGGRGRPMADLRARLDAVFWVITRNGPWKNLPEEFGPADSASRQFRRWAQKGIWQQLLTDCAAPGAHPTLRRLEHWLCRALRRALRIIGVNGIRLARRLGLKTALPGPPWMCPDPDLSEALWPHISKALREATALLDHGFRKAQAPLRVAIEAGKSYHRLVGGRRWIPSWLAPP